MFSTTTKTHTVRWKSLKQYLTSLILGDILIKMKGNILGSVLKHQNKWPDLIFFLVSSDLIPMVTNNGMYTGYRTDHSLVYLYISIRIPKEAKKTRSYSAYKIKEERAKESELEFKINKLTDHLVYCRHTGASEGIILIS